MTRISINADEVFALAGRLDRVDGPLLNAALVKSVNATVDHFDPLLRQAMIRGINLPASYVDQRMEVDRATTTPHAEIIAWGPDRPNRAGLTILGKYAPEVVTKPAPRAKGDRSRGVPAGQRAAGVSVEVTRGARKVIPGAFTMRLRVGSAGGQTIGVFIRRAGKARHLYAVSPYSLFRFQASAHVDEMTDYLADRAPADLQDSINEVL